MEIAGGSAGSCGIGKAVPKIENATLYSQIKFNRLYSNIYLENPKKKFCGHMLVAKMLLLEINNGILQFEHRVRLDLLEQ